MKILFLSPHVKISGGMRIILTYADLLASMGHDTVVVIPHKQRYRRILANVVKRNPRWFPHFRASVLRVESFDEKFLPPADILVAGNYNIALQMEKFSKRAGAQFYLVQHDERLYHGEREVVDRAYRLPLKKLAVATWLQELLKKKYGQESELLLNPFDRTLFHPLRKESHDEVRILVLDHTYEWKGTKEGVEIVSDLKKKYPSIRLVGFGVRREHSEYDFNEYHFDVPQEKLAWLYSRADIFLCSSWDEGFGLPSIEAMACKTAVVTYDNGGSRDFAFDGKTAMVAERRNKERLKAKLEELVINKALRDKIAEGGYRFVQTLPTWEDQVLKMENIFQKIFT
jgi:glycosyltransferase involved in cell wall biosynthesis